MKPRLADILYKIDRTIKPVLEISTIAALILLVVAALDTPAKRILTYCLYAVAAVWVIALLCRLLLSPFVISDEEEDFEKKVEYILQKKQFQYVSIKLILIVSIIYYFLITVHNLRIESMYAGYGA